MVWLILCVCCLETLLVPKTHLAGGQQRPWPSVGERLRLDRSGSAPRPRVCSALTLRATPSSARRLGPCLPPAAKAPRSTTCSTAWPRPWSTRRSWATRWHTRPCSNKIVVTTRQILTLTRQWLLYSHDKTRQDGYYVLPQAVKRAPRCTSLRLSSSSTYMLGNKILYLCWLVIN